MEVVAEAGDTPAGIGMPPVTPNSLAMVKEIHSQCLWHPRFLPFSQE